MQVMDTPERTRIVSSTTISKFEESPFSSYINNLSPIQPIKSSHITQSLNPFTIGSLPSIFTSPHVSSNKESRFLKRHQDLDPSKPEVASTNHETVSEHESAETELREKIQTPIENVKFPIELPRNLRYECGSPDYGPSKSNPGAFSQRNSEISNPSECEAHTGQRKEGEGFEWESFVADTTDILIFSSPNDAEAFRGIIQRSPATIPSYSSSLASSYDITNVQNMQLVCQTAPKERIDAGNSSWSVEGNDVKEMSHVQDNPSEPDPVDLSQYSSLNIDNETETRLPLATKPILYVHRGVRRRCLDFELPGAQRKRILNGSSYSSTSSQPEENCAPRNLQLVSAKQGGGDSSRCAMPGIGLHLNSLATLTRSKILKCESSSSETKASNMPTSMIPLPSASTVSEKDMDPSENMQLQLLEDPSQTSPYLNMDDLNQNSPRKKRRRVEHVGEDESSCKRCNCKKSKCLKLYCECFAAGVYCIEPCACQDCFNKPIHEDMVLATRKQIESRNPLAFAPKVIRTSDPVIDIRDESMKTPASARHKRGCNCKKSSCLKKYCECYQGGVGCSTNCRCESCKNVFGTKDGSIVGGGDCDPEEEEKFEKGSIEVSLKPEHARKDDPNHPSSVLPTTPSTLCRSSVPLSFPSKNKPPRSSFLGSIGTSYILHQSGVQKLLPLPKLESLSSKPTTSAEDEVPDILRGSSTTTPVKTSSPNSKRVSPPHGHVVSSPTLKSGRRLILQSIPSFPSLHNINES